MADLKLQFACGAYDRIEPLRRGQVRPRNIELETITDYHPRELFDRLMQSGEFDLAEMSSSEHIAMTCAGTNPFVAIPVFPSKVFRHGFIAINTTRGIESPKDLAGKRIGVPLHTMTAAVWCRGILEDEYGVDLSGVTWVQGAVNEPGSHGTPSPPPLLKPVDIVQNETGRSLSDMLADGEIDALLGAVLPDSLWTSANVRRLFPDYREVEKDYYRRTKIHPIMHVVVIRKKVYEDNPWIVRPLYEAFEKSKNMAWQEATYNGAQKYMLPWLYSDIDEIRDIFAGGDPWPYGLEANRATLERQIEMMHRHYMIDRKPSLDELFIGIGT